MIMSIFVVFTLLIAGGLRVNSEESHMSPAEVKYCCNIVSEMPECHSACMKFASKCPPAAENKTEYLTDFCDEIPNTLDVCLSNTNLSSEFIACCSSSENQACEDVCIEQLYIGVLDDAAIQKVIGECGPVINFGGTTDPVWSCFFQFADDNPPSTDDDNEQDEGGDEDCPEETPTNPESSLQITYADWPRLGCCERTNSTECREACETEYSGNRVDGSWEKINLDCKFQPYEDDFAICLADVADQCRFGCSGLDFCENLNNRPFQLFRDCNSIADSSAESAYESWKSGIVNLPLVTVSIKDVTECLPDMWKAAACAIYTRPCNNETHSSILCKDECLQLMEQCSESETMTPEEICELLSPSDLQEKCVSFAQFTEPSTHELDSYVTSPCKSSPCKEGFQCIVNHDCSGNRDKACTPYSCTKESNLGKSPPLLSLVETKTVHVATLPPLGKQCFGFVHQKNGIFGQQLSNLSNTYCKPESQCSFEGKHYNHKDMIRLSDGCNFCTCFHGDVFCTEMSCKDNDKTRTTPLLSCDCDPLIGYVPVCTVSGRTLPNSCIARCLGFSNDQITAGSCGDNDPCDHTLCPEDTKCVPHRQVCLPGVNVTSCPQYTCESYFSCNKFSRPLCDKSNNQHNSVCDIFLTEEEIDYFGYCQTECSNGRSQKVCGVNGETFQTKCHAQQEGITVDYVGECAGLPTRSKSDEVCSGIKCPGERYFSPNESCKGPVPPGACCPQCGGVVTAIINMNGLESSRNTMNLSSINSTNLITRMRSLLDVLECHLDGYLALDNSFVFLLMPTNYSSFLNVEICNAEAMRLTTLINNHSPVLAADPFLYFLVGASPSLATRQSVPPIVVNIVTEPNGCGTTTPLALMLLMLILICSWIIH